MRPHLPALAILLFAAILEAAPADHIGRLLPRLELLDGTIYMNATITAVDEKGITITVDGAEKTISRFLLQPVARVALGYPEDPDKIPRTGYFRVFQVGGGGIIVRDYRPAKFDQGMAEITGRRARAEEGDTLLFLKGEPGFAVADRDIIKADYIATGETLELKTIDGGTRTLSLLLLVSAEISTDR